jgi:hypothetical protein
MRTEELTSEEIEKAREKAHHALFLNPKWWAQNIGYVIKNPEDFSLASKYALGALKLAFAH